MSNQNVDFLSAVSSNDWQQAALILANINMSEQVNAYAKAHLTNKEQDELTKSFIELMKEGRIDKETAQNVVDGKCALGVLLSINKNPPSFLSMNQLYQSRPITNNILKIAAVLEKQMQDKSANASSVRIK
jgi:hypothetical protein